MTAISLAIAGRRATIAIDRPEKRNALERADLAAFAASLAEVHAEPDVRVLVVTAAGEKAFCAGVALEDVAAGDWTDNPLTALCDGLEQFPLPTICALNGGVWGGGVEIAAACDFRIGVDDARCALPPARLGVHYEPAGIARVLRVVGPAAARRLLLAVETLDAEAMRACGLLDRVVARDALAAETASLADRLSAMAPLAIRGMKRTLVELAAGTLDAEAARARVAECWASADHREGLAAMREKRDPVFDGR